MGNLVSRVTWMRLSGTTQEEALNNIREAIELYLQPDTIELVPGAVVREVILG